MLVPDSATVFVDAVPHAYHVYLAAFRARYYIEGEYSDSSSTTGSTAGVLVVCVFVRSYPHVCPRLQLMGFGCFRLLLVCRGRSKTAMESLLLLLRLCRNSSTIFCQVKWILNLEPKEIDTDDIYFKTTGNEK